MTQNDKSTADPRNIEKKPQPQPKDDRTTPETPVSDKQVPKDGTGEHGRPTDDSDPGHS
ncbi:hypothetical protein ACFOPQ_09475 [Deinococcus antarcticus]|uniref:Uncharacterized protein n=1 Tax=Deinococcus antarcticus TaxID=1298767 RepID=A0ABV8A6C2_9DEIO